MKLKKLSLKNGSWPKKIPVTGIIRSANIKIGSKYG